MLSIGNSKNRVRKRIIIIFLIFTIVFASIGPIGIDTVQAGGHWSFLGDLGFGAAIDFTFGNAFRFFAWIFFSMADGLVSAAAFFFDVSIRYSLDLGTNLDTYGLGGLKTGWAIFRDIANMAFIFLLLYIAIMTILQIGNFQTKRILVSLIIVGILINFSFFLTGFVIDIGNVTGGFVYSAMAPAYDPVTGAGGIGGNILGDGLKLSKLKEEGLGNLSNVDTGIIHLMGGILLLVAAFVFLSGAILFVLRTVVLMFVLVLSPFAFIAAILPNTNKYWTMWLSKLMGNTFVAPIYLLMIAVVVAIINSGDMLTNLGANDQSFNQALLITQSTFSFATSAGIMLNYVLLIGLLLGSLSVARILADGIASTSTKWAKKTTGFAGARAAGLAARGWRNSAGRIAQARADNQGLQDRARAGDRGAILKLKAYQGIANTSGDIRNIPGVNAAAKAGGFNVGKAGGKGGFAKIIEDKAKKEEKFADSLDMTDAQREAYAKRRASRRSPSRLWMGTSQKDRAVAQRIGKLKERVHNREVDNKIKDFKKVNDYDAKQQAVTKATRDLDMHNQARARARADNLDTSTIEAEIKVARQNLDNVLKPLKELDASIKEINSTKKSTGKTVKSIEDSLKDFYASNPQNTV